MTNLEQIKRQVKQLNPADFAEFRKWFLEYDQLRWDKQLEADSNAGKLDFLIKVALTAHEARSTRDL